MKVPKVRAKDGHPVTFRSAWVPPYVCKTRSLEAALLWLYLKGVSTGKLEETLEVFMGSEVKGLSASTVARLKRQWADEYEIWRKSRLDRDRWLSLWADGIYSGLRVEDTKLCVRW